mgnify:CR=1 FL=1
MRMAEKIADVPQPLITSDPNRLGGTPCFAGTRVPVQTFYEYMEGGESLETFLGHFPSVTRQHAEAVLGLSKAELVAEMSGAVA